MVYLAVLERPCIERYRGFESHLLRYLSLFHNYGIACRRRIPILSAAQRRREIGRPELYAKEILSAADLKSLYLKGFFN